METVAQDRLFSGLIGALPADLDGWEAGPLLGLILTGADPASLTEADRVDLLRALQRQVSRLTAELYRVMASVAAAVIDTDGDPELGWESAALEIGTALQLTRRAAESELDTATALTERVPDVLAALRCGSVDLRRARVIIHHTTHLDDVGAASVAAAVLEEAPRLTTGQLAARLRRLCIEIDPATARHRYAEAIDGRRVVAEPTEDGTCHLLGLDLPPDRVTAVTDRLTAIAHALRREGETRSIDQLRADTLLDLLEGRHLPHATRRGVVDVTVDLATLAELNEAAGDLGGYGPVVADIARRVAASGTDARWRFTVTDGDDVVHTGITRRRPTATQRRTVEAVHRRCGVPGCRMPSGRCDLDHSNPWQDGGVTCTCNLVPLCRHHHKHRHHRWRYRRLPDRRIEWTSPLGRVYTTSGVPP